MNNIIGFGLSVAGIILVMGVAEIAVRRFSLEKFYARKIIHIGVANWWFIAMEFFDHFLYPVAGLLGFILINYYLHKSQLLLSMKGDDKNSGDGALGTVYYPLALIIISYLCFTGILPFYIGTASVLILGYSDGMAAVMGKAFGKIKYSIFLSTKSMEGSATFFLVTFAILTGVLWERMFTQPGTLWIIMTVSFFLALTEALTPKGMDNITIPVTTSFFLFFLFENPHPGIGVNLLFALTLNLTLAFLAYLKKSVSESGFLAGSVLGIILYMTAGYKGWILLTSFFLSSTILSFYKKANKKTGISGKGSRRDHIQVLANVLPPAVFSGLYAYTGETNLLIGIGVAFSAANADTWASEIGVLSKNPPVSIINLKPVERGLSGGVSFLGMIASVMGALFIGGIFYSLFSTHFHPTIIAWITLGGFMGSLVDSFLGATVQVAYRENTSGRITEKAGGGNFHSSHSLIKGIPFVDNDMVNFMSISFAGILMGGVFFFLYG